MTIGSPSGSGATQNDIADGSDESQGRWMTLYDGSLTYNPANVATGGAGATPTFATTGLEMTSGTSGDSGVVQVGGGRIRDTAQNSVQSIIIKTRYASGTAIGSLSDTHAIGVTRGFNPVTIDDIAVFNPAAGNNTAGNVRVDEGGTDTDGSVTYPDISEAHTYVVLLDFGGNYLQSGHTGFYIDSDPRLGDSPNADLAAIPTNATDPMGLAYNSNGNDQSMFSDFLEVTVRI